MKILFMFVLGVLFLAVAQASPHHRCVHFSGEIGKVYLLIEILRQGKRDIPTVALADDNDNGVLRVTTAGCSYTKSEVEVTGSGHWEVEQEVGGGYSQVVSYVVLLNKAGRSWQSHVLVKNSAGVAVCSEEGVFKGDASVSSP